MYPLLNEKMKIKIIRKEKYDIGDLVLYTKFNRIILHRVIEINGTACRVKGDNTLSDDIIQTRQILGGAIGYSTNGNNVPFLKNRISEHIIPSILRKIDEVHLKGKIITTKILRLLLVNTVIMYRTASICYSLVNKKSFSKKEI